MGVGELGSQPDEVVNTAGIYAALRGTGVRGRRRALLPAGGAVVEFARGDEEVLHSQETVGEFLGA